MISNLFFQISGIIFIIVLLKVYFSKERLVSINNNIYTKVILVNLISLTLDVLSTCMVLTFGTEALISVITVKLYLASILIWLLFLTTYIYTISFKKVEIFSLAKSSSVLKLLTVIIPVGVVSLITIIILPINLINKANAIYFDGSASSFIYIFSFICVFIWLLRYIKRVNYIKGKYSKLIIFISIFVLLGTTIQFLYPELLIFTFMMYFVTFSMYFGIDNPDLKLIKELAAAKKKVEETEVSTKDSLLKASHAIRTPLNTIAGFSQSIIEGTSENIAEDIKHIKDASTLLSNMVNDILDVSNVDMKMYKLVYDDYNVEMLMKQIFALAKEKMTSKKVELNIMIDDNIPPFLFGDSIRIKEIVLNVVCNAIKHTRYGNINLNISCITVGNVCRLIVSVKDTGMGIPVDKLEKIFDEKVFKDKELAGGISDINLATIKEIIESMNGQITVESEYREGTTITLDIDQKIGNDPNPINAIKEEASLETGKISFDGKKVLIVDDDRINLKVATRLLKNYNVEVEEVSNGYKCVEKVKNGEKFDLIFLDDWMPNMSGVETLRQLDMIEGFNTPVIALTANAMGGMKEKYIKDGFNDFIPKPIERKELDRVMKRFLSNNN